MPVEASLVNQLEEMIFNNHRVTEPKLKRVRENHPLLLVAYCENQAIGFKLGYLIPETEKFFSWLGGVRPDYRRQGIAQALLIHQEHFAHGLGVPSIYFTTYDRFPAMIQLGKKNEYRLIKSEMDDGEMKFWYEKAFGSAQK